MEKDVATEAWIPFLQSEYNLIGPQLNGPNLSFKKYRNKKNSLFTFLPSFSLMFSSVLGLGLELGWQPGDEYLC